MPDNKKKKSQLAQEAYEQQAQQLEQTGQEVVSGLTSAGEQYRQSLDAANQARTEAYNQAQQLYKQRMDEGYTQFADIIAGEQKRAEQAEQDAIEQYNAERQAARWTGATELAASIANLVSVGGHNAVSQQYHSYSQDWMKKADENWRQNRARFDNLRDRQRALQQQLTQLKMGDAGTALNLATRQADQAYQHGAQSAQIGYQTATAPMNVKMQTAKEAGAARTQGVVTGINVDLHERQIEEQAAARRESAAARRETVAMNAAMHGLKRNPDGSYSLDPASPVTQATLRAGSGSGGGASRNTLYYYDADGRLTPVYMTATEYDKFVEQSYASVKDNEDFKAAYRRAATDTERKSIIYEFATQIPERRSVLSQYGTRPENYVERPEAPAQETNTPGYATSRNDKTGLGNYQ